MEASEAGWSGVLTAVAFLVFLAATARASLVAAYLSGLAQRGTARLA